MTTTPSARHPTYTAHNKIEAVERAISLCKKVSPKMIAKGEMTRGQTTSLLDILTEVILDYSLQVLTETSRTRVGCSTLHARESSITLTRHDAE